MPHSPDRIYILPGVFAFYAIFILAFWKKCINENCINASAFLLLTPLSPLPKFPPIFSPKVFYFSFPQRGSAGKEIRNIPFPICGRKGGENYGVHFP